MTKSEIHMHSTYSDGEFTPAQLVEIAQKNGVSILSLTDHDNFGGVRELVEAAEAVGITAFPGIEITTLYRDFNLHLLCYFKTPECIDAELMGKVHEMTEGREKRMRQLIKRINEVIPERFQGTIEFENVRRAAEGVLARPHLAREMVRLGIVANTQEAFDKYLVKYNLEKKNLDVKEAITLARKCGGIPVLAHPGERSYSLHNPAKGRGYEDVPEMVDELKSYGLMGMECVYPYHERIGKVDYYTRLAKDRGLIVTGSRDFHGFATSQTPDVLGTTKMEPAFLEEFQTAWSADEPSVANG